MDKQIQREAEMKELDREAPSLKHGIAERTSVSINDPDTMLSMTVLLFACLALAVLAHAVI
jgi:hypothetical protein